MTWTHEYSQLYEYSYICLNNHTIHRDGPNSKVDAQDFNTGVIKDNDHSWINVKPWARIQLTTDQGLRTYDGLPNDRIFNSANVHIFRKNIGS